MTIRTKVYVSGASGIVGYGIIRSLRLANSNYMILGSSNKSMSATNAFADESYLAPMTGTPEYLDWLEDFLTQQKPTIAIPGIEADNLLWNEARDVFARTGTKLLMNDEQLIRLASDKWVFYNCLLEIGEATVIESVLADDFETVRSLLGLPFIVKPRRGYGARGFRVIHERADFGQAYQPGLIAQPLVGNDSYEFTVSAFGDGRGGIAHLFAMKRSLDVAGFTSIAEITEPSIFSDPIRRLSAHFRPFGPTNFQFRVDQERLFLLEINPRISSSTSIRSRFGYNEAAMAVDYLLTGEVMRPHPATRGVAIRYTEDFLIDMPSAEAPPNIWGDSV